jgi:hypothetical protein
MRTLLLLALVLAGALAVFFVRGREALARRDQAHVDLLRREQDLERLRTTLGTPDEAEFEALLAEHVELVSSAEERLAQLARTEGAVERPRLAELLARSPDTSLQPGGRLHAGLRAQAGLPAEDGAEAAPASVPEGVLAAIVAALEPLAGALVVDTLELKAAGRVSAVPDVPKLGHVEAQLVVTGALPDVLRALEALAPVQGGGLPAVSVLDASLRRIEPSRWGESLHQLETPPVRLTASLDVLVPAPGGS